MIDTSGYEHDYTACALFRGGLCTCDAAPGLARPQNRVQFFDDQQHGQCAYGEFSGTGFVVMNAVYANAPNGPARINPEIFMVWHVQDALKDQHGNWWFRGWHGVMDDFGNLVEIEVEEFPF